MPAAIELHEVAKRFRLRGSRAQFTTLKSAIVDLALRRRADRADRFAALQNVDLSVNAGRTLGIIGRNGSGKSTLLKIMAGIYRPDSGRVHVRGRVAALIELGAGFHPELTGRENIVINGMVLGLSRREILRRLEKIVAFADLAEFIDEPARTYSSGMYMRLGFSVAVHLDPDILLIDEVLAIGDEPFAKKCADRIADFQRLGKTIVLVTHDPGAIERWCDEAVWLDGGIIRAIGMPRKVLDLYHDAIAETESKVLGRSYESARETETLQRWGNREIEIVRVRMTDRDGRERYVYEGGESFQLTLTYRVHRRVERPVFGFAVLRADGLWVYGTNTAIADVRLPPLGTTGTVEITLERLDLIAGGYFLDVAVHAEDGAPYDYHSRLYPFSVRSHSTEVGVVRLPHAWRIEPDRAESQDA